jgi:peptide/nickel transport system substrate-binding protein
MSGTDGPARRGRLSRREFLRASAILVAASACGPTTTPAAPTAAPAGQQQGAPAPKGATPAGTLTVGLSQELKTLDPARNPGFNEHNHLYTNLFNWLVARNKDGGLSPDLATSWEAVSNTEWIFKLRQGVKFHNGEVFNAESVKGTIERYHEPGKERFATVQSAFKGAELIDDYTVKIITTKTEPLILERLYKMPIVPPKHIKQVGDDAFAQKPVGTGPFRFVEQVTGDRVVLEAYPEYFAGPAKSKTVVLRAIPEIATRISALRAGEVDLITQVPPDQTSLVASDPNLRVASVASPRVIYLEFFPNSPVANGKPFADPRVRLALNHAINVDSITKNILNDQAARVATLVAPQQFGYDATAQPYAYDPEKAKQLLNSAGFGTGNLEVTFQVPTGGNPVKPIEVGQAIAADWQKVGIKVDLQTIETNTYSQMKLDYKIGPVFMWNWAGFDADEPIWGNASNDSTWSYWPGRMPPKMAEKDEVDKLIDEERSIVDRERRKQIFAQLQKIMVEEASFIPLYQQKDIYGVHARMRGWEPITEGPVFLWGVDKS